MATDMIAPSLPQGVGYGVVVGIGVRDKMVSQLMQFLTFVVLLCYPHGRNILCSSEQLHFD